MKKIAVRFGHQTTGADGGAVGYVKETDVNRRYGALVISKLQALGYEVLNVTPPEAYRSLSNSLNYGIDMANNWGAELFISCHVNANVNTSQPMGCEVVCSGRGLGLEYAIKISNALANLGFKNRGAKSDERGLAEIRNTAMPCLICEPFFLDSSADISIYNKVGNEGIANAIVKGLTGSVVSSSNSTSTTSSASSEKVITPKTEKLQKQLEAWIYWLNGDYNAKITVRPKGAYVESELYPNIECVGNIIKLGHKSHLVEFYQQKLQMWNYLQPNTYKVGEFDTVTRGAVTELQKKWGRITDGKILISNNTAQIFLQNE